jgi:hypothetical protein
VHSGEPFPSVSAYLERLPFGIDSHPECEVKASVLRDALASRALDSDLDALPAPVRELVRSLPPVSAWVREVHVLVVILAIRDRYFAPGPAGLEEYERWTRQRNRALLTRPLYRALFLVVSPERLIEGMQRRWSHFRRGTRIELVERAPRSVVVRVRFPAELYEETMLHGLRGALHAALEAAGARETAIDFERKTPREAWYRLHWR